VQFRFVKKLQGRGQKSQNKEKRAVYKNIIRTYNTEIWVFTHKNKSKIQAMNKKFFTNTEGRARRDIIGNSGNS
jgi:hypothetical protein